MSNVEIVNTGMQASFSGLNNEDRIPVSSRVKGPSTFSKDHPRSDCMSAGTSSSGQTIESSPLVLVTEANLPLAHTGKAVSGERREMAKLLGRCVRDCGTESARVYDGDGPGHSLERM